MCGRNHIQRRDAAHSSSFLGEAARIHELFLGYVKIHIHVTVLMIFLSFWRCFCGSQEIQEHVPLMMVTRETEINSQHGLEVTNIFSNLYVNTAPNMYEVFLQLTSFHNVVSSWPWAGWCGRYVCCDVLIVCQMGLYGGPLVCNVKWEFYYLCCTVLWELLSYLALENSLGEGSGILQLQNGQLI